jgi:hypothetical protein
VILFSSVTYSVICYFYVFYRKIKNWAWGDIFGRLCADDDEEA